jgi:large subunit ribosomal protein L29
MKIAEVREMSDKDLLERLDAERIAYDQLVLNHSVTPLDSPTDIKKKRRDIARMLTVLHQRELNKK